MLVNEIMVKEVITISSDDTVLEACKRYSRFKIGCLIVMNEEKMAGIITERDIIHRVIIKQKNPFTTKVDDIMSRDILTIHPSADVKDAADIMGKHKIKKLPVLSDNGSLAGIITITDIANVIPNFLKIIAEGGDSESFRYAVSKFHS
jgi:CBS domain-containing protein